jgi:hypothetical protein
MIDGGGDGQTEAGMAATAAQKAQLRRMIAESTATTYTDAMLATYIETYPVTDARGEYPWVESTTTPGTLEANDDWTATYDLNAAAADLWAEKAASVAAQFDFNADGGSFNRSQKYQFAMAQSRYYRARRAAKTITARPEPRPDSDELIEDSET